MHPQTEGEGRGYSVAVMQWIGATGHHRGMALHYERVGRTGPDKGGLLYGKCTIDCCELQ